jgi:hypothetical protein
MRTRTALLIVCASVAQATMAQTGWSVASTPAVSLGGDLAGKGEMFTVVYGATRLSDGNILVADDGNFGLRIVSPSGALVKQFGRKGRGPGELAALYGMRRCGDSVFTVERLSQKISVFGLDGTFARTFRFAAPPGTTSPSRSRCNTSGDFLHMGWHIGADLKPGLYRTAVPFWLSGADPRVKAVIGSMPGDEVQGIIGERVRGSGEALVGRRVITAIDRDRVYIGSGDGYEIGVFDFTGKRASTIGKTNAPPVPVTKADANAIIAHRLSLVTDQERPAHQRQLETFEVAKTFPPYAALVVDSEGLLWVQDYPKPRSPATRWTVFTRDGLQRAELQLPTALEVYEIGADYILGRYLDTQESIPQVRVYKLERPRS